MSVKFPNYPYSPRIIEEWIRTFQGWLRTERKKAFSNGDWAKYVLIEKILKDWLREAACLREDEAE